MNVTTKTPEQASPPAPDFEAERHAATELASGFPLVKGAILYDMTFTAGGALNEIEAIAKMALRWLETPEGQHHIEIVAVALQAIWSRASDASELVGDCAENAGIKVPDEARVRRRTAASDLRERWVEEVTQGRA